MHPESQVILLVLCVNLLQLRAGELQIVEEKVQVFSRCKHSFFVSRLDHRKVQKQFGYCVLHREDGPHLVRRQIPLADVVQSRSCTSLCEVSKGYSFHLVKRLLSSSDGLRHGSNCLFSRDSLPLGDQGTEVLFEGSSNPRS
jgi:hypothetical protein